MRISRAALSAALLLGNACNSCQGQLIESTGTEDSFPSAGGLVSESRAIDLSQVSKTDRDFAPTALLPGNNPGNPAKLLGSQNSVATQTRVPELSVLTVDELQAMALASNPSIRSAAALVQAARGRAYQVGLQANPDVGIDFQQLASDGRAEQYGVTLGQRWVRREKLERNRATQSHEVQRLTQELYMMRMRVATDVNLAYIRALRAQRQIDVSRELLSIGQKSLLVAQQLFAAMEVSRTDVLRAEVEVENAEVALRDAELSHMAAWANCKPLRRKPTYLLRHWRETCLLSLGT